MAGYLRRRKQLSSPRQGKIGRGALFGLVTIILIAGGVGYAAVQGKIPKLFQRNTVRTDLITVPVKRGDLRITVVETGNLDSASNVTVSSQVEGTTKIIKVVPEGTKAYKGMVLVELDSSTFRDKAVQQQIELKQAESLYEQAQKALEIQETQNLSDIAAAKLQWDLADLDLTKYRKGEYQQLKTDIEAKITLAKEDLAQKLDKYAFSKRQSKKGYVNQNELEQARIGVTKAELDLKSADLELKVLETYDYKRSIAEKEANAREFELEFERTKLKALAATSQARADLGARELTASVEKTKYNKLLKQIGLCTLVAPQEGQVVYATSSSRRSNQERVIEEGATVDQRQQIIKLPDLSKMQVDTKIHESKIGLVKEGMRAFVKVKAESDRHYEGIVESVASVPNSPSWRQPDLREYTAVIKIVSGVNDAQILKPGLTAEVEVIADVLDSVLKIPVQASVARNGKFFVFVLKNGKPEIRQVVLGATNDIETEIKQIEGSDPKRKFPVNVQEGDQIVLAPRTSLPTLYGILEDAEQEKPAEADGEKGRGKKGRGKRGQGPKASKGGSKGKKPKQEGGEKNKPSSQGAAVPASRVGKIFKQYDKDNDGKLTKEEVAGGRLADSFAKIDANSDGKVDQSELETAMAAFAKSRAGGGSQ